MIFGYYTALTKQYFNYLNKLIIFYPNLIRKTFYTSLQFVYPITQTQVDMRLVIEIILRLVAVGLSLLITIHQVIAHKIAF